MANRRYVHPGQSQVIGRDRRDYKAMNTATAGISVAGFDTAPRQHAADGSAKEAKKTFKDLRGTFTEEQMKIETSRCLGSGGSRKARHQEDRKKVSSRYARDRSCPLNGQNRHRFCERNDIKEVAEIVLDIGELSLVIPKYVEDIYPVVVGDTWLKDTKLVINVIPGMAECDECNELFHVIEHEGYCPNCGSFEKTILSGKDFLIREIHIPEG